ncbi:MAG: AAA family ATPase [Oscillospiraceae bacterium]|jgi:DNA repair exonuclease SbcCD ATPase subunit|nr:AAA family ATPase [Oscillospiraceae bacterium]
MSNVVTSVKIKNTPGFNGEFTADFCPGVNVLIGGNGSGKTTILRKLYEETRLPKIFIPVAEMLSHSKGLLALDKKLKMPYDQTEIDVLMNAELPETREVSPVIQTLLTQISKVINGEVLYENDTFFVVKKDGRKVRFADEASGFQKFGLLWKLLRNGLIESGSVLFWDEPEASINPELIPTLVDVLLTIQKTGVQIFIATHNYDVAQWLELNKTAETIIRYFNLRKVDGQINADVSDNYDTLNSVIDEADNKLLRRVVLKASGARVSAK